MEAIKKRRDLTKGDILPQIIVVALPIMATAFIQMAYNLFDTIWIGKVGYEAMTAVATAGFFVWISRSLIILARKGAEIGVAQSLGAGDERRARDYARNAFQFSMILAFVYAAFILVFCDQLIAFFDVPNPVINQGAVIYLRIIALGLPFFFTNLIFAGIYNSSAFSHTSFRFNAVGLIINIILDPILILGLFGFPRLEIIGAAVATVFAQSLVSMLFIWHIKGRHSPFSEFYFWRKIDFSMIKELINYGWPVALQNFSFAIFAMLIAKQMSFFGDKPMGVQRIGAQIESITWMTAQGLGAALIAFIGQNFGAKKLDRVKTGYFKSLYLMLAWGLFTTVVLWLFAEPIYGLFTDDKEVISIGIDYLKIIAYSQIFMMVEIATNSAFNGIGITIAPAVISLVFTGLRVPFAYLLSRKMLLGLNGIWWTLSISSIIKGIIALALFLWILKHQLEKMIHNK